MRSWESIQSAKPKLPPRTHIYNNIVSSEFELCAPGETYHCVLQLFHSQQCCACVYFAGNKVEFMVINF